MDSILITMKAMLGISPDDNAFDMELIVHINSIISILRQLGVPGSVSVLAGPKTKWTDVFGTDDYEKMELVKTFMYLRLRLLFDPPSASNTANAFEQMAKEYEWRLNVDAWNQTSETE